MPYSGPDDATLPEHVKEYDRKWRRAWVKIFNSVFERCEQNKGTNCEAQAMKVANSMLKQMQMGGGHRMFFIDLAQLITGRAFDAMTPGSFIDMLGRKVTFKKEELADYVRNTLAAIAATKTESGEVVGLPIDAKGHDKGDGAGWIVDVRLENNKIRIVPKWTEIGQELIQKGIRRFFSPTVDVENKVILGGSLTNWPATRDPKGKILLRPIEMGQTGENLLVIDEASDFTDLAAESMDQALEITGDPASDLEESIDERVDTIRQAFYTATRPKPEQKAVPDQPWVARIYEDYVIVRHGAQYFKVGYSENEEGEIVFDPRNKWVEVNKRETWVEAAIAEIADIFRRFTNFIGRGELQEDDQFDTSDWDAAKAVRGKSIQELRAICLIDGNEPGREGGPIASNFRGPYRYTPQSKPNKNAIRALGSGARGLTVMKKPPDCSEARWNSELKSAANRLIGWWKPAFGTNAPEAIYKIAGKSRPAESSLEEVIEMEITKEELTSLISEQVGAALSTHLSQAVRDMLGQNPAAETGSEAGVAQMPPETILRLLEMEGASSELVAAFKEAMLKQFDSIKTRAAQQAAEMIAAVRRESVVHDFVRQVTEGSPETPRGLAVEAEALEKFILSLNPDQAAFIQPLLQRIVIGEGLVEYEELGNAKRSKGTTPLPEYIARKLRTKELRLEDLSEPMLGLGDISQYDLSEWQVR